MQQKMSSLFSTISKSLSNRLLLNRFPFNGYIMSSKFSTDSLVVEHDGKREFFIKLGKEKALINYKRVGDTLDMYHTEVPVELRGQGIAGKLAKGAFEFVDKNDLQMILTCPYLQKYLKDNPNDAYSKRVR